MMMMYNYYLLMKQIHSRCFTQICIALFLHGSFAPASREFAPLTAILKNSVPLSLLLRGSIVSLVSPPRTPPFFLFLF